MEVVGVIAAVPGLVQIIQAVITAVRGVSKKDVAPKVAQNLIQSLRNVEQILERGKEQGVWDKPQFEQYKSTIKHWTTELASLKLVLQPSNIKRDTRRSLKKLCLVLTELEETLNQWSTRLCQIQTELVLILTDVQQRIMRDTLKETVNARLRADLHPCSATFIPDKTPGTCEWIWSQSTFSDWVRGSSNSPESNLHRILCIYGIKGCGKSVLVHSIAQQLRERGQIALHFSFWSSNENQQQLEHLLRTVVWQVSRHITDSDFEKLSKLVTRSDGIDKRSLVKAFRIALSGISQKVYCTIDGIDESTEDWNHDTDGCLSTILDLIKSHTNLHVLLSGRETSMRTLLKKAVPRLEITEHLIRSDIDKLITVEIQDSLGNYSPVLRADAQKDLQAKTQMMFLWVTLVLRELRRCSSAEDVRQTLQQVPHDLDREYHRLLLQLMARTRGTAGKPSISMKRAKYILFSILSCPEPMTAEDLCYAYARQTNSTGTIEDDLITVDGIFDACGDFVRVTEGRYHILHTSTADFLTRAQSEWELEDMDISYFRIDLPEAQESMSLACLKYIKFIDIGYPLTDGEALSLPSKYKFFSYAARYLPFHLTHALQDSQKAQFEMNEFVRTHQFCALMEYILATSQNSLQKDILDTFYYWYETFHTGVEQTELDLAFNLELTRREKDFGTGDERYQSWLAMSFLFPTNSHQLLELQTAPSTRLRRNGTVGMGMEGRAISMLHEHNKKTHGPVIQRLSASLQSFSQIFSTLKSTGSDLLASPAESLPVPILLLAATVAMQQEKWPLSEKLAAVSIRRTRGKGDIFELCSLLSLAGVKYYVNDDTSERTEQMVRESVRIATCLPTQLHVQWLKLQSVQILVLMLLGQDRTEDAGGFIRMYEDLIGMDRKRCDSRAWEYGLAHTRMGILYRTRTLDRAARRLYDDGKFTVSAKFAAQAIAILEDSRTKPTSEHLGFFLTHRDALHDAGEFDECISSCHRILSFLRRLACEPVFTDIQWQTQLLVARCRAKQGNATEADKWFRKAADEINLLPNQRHQKGQFCLLFMVEALAFMGRYELAQSMARELLENKEISYVEDEEGLGFGPLEPLVSKLKDIGSIEPHYKEFLRCYLLLMAGEGMHDAADKASFWKGGLMRQYDGVQLFRKTIPLLKLKYIETCLRQDDGLLEAARGYNKLGRFFFEQGCTEAADLVSSDAASRVHLAYYPSYPSLVSTLTRDAYLYAGRFSKCITFLCEAYQLSLEDNSDAGYIFEVEMFYASTYIQGLETFEEDLEKADLRSSFLERSCEHLSKALRARNEIQWYGCPVSEEDHGDDEYDAEEDRTERITDLETRLEELDGGTILAEVVAKTTAVVLGDGKNVVCND